jgi:hypothetical protein
MRVVILPSSEDLRKYLFKFFLQTETQMGHGNPHTDGIWSIRAAEAASIYLLATS